MIIGIILAIVTAYIIIAFLPEILTIVFCIIAFAAFFGLIALIGGIS